MYKACIWKRIARLYVTQSIQQMIATHANANLKHWPTAQVAVLMDAFVVCCCTRGTCQHWRSRIPHGPTLLYRSSGPVELRWFSDCFISFLSPLAGFDWFCMVLYVLVGILALVEFILYPFQSFFQFVLSLSKRDETSALISRWYNPGDPGFKIRAQ